MKVINLSKIMKTSLLMVESLDLALSFGTTFMPTQPAPPPNSIGVPLYGGPLGGTTVVGGGGGGGGGGGNSSSCASHSSVTINTPGLYRFFITLSSSQDFNSVLNTLYVCNRASVTFVVAGAGGGGGYRYNPPGGNGDLIAASLNVSGPNSSYTLTLIVGDAQGKNGNGGLSNGYGSYYGYGGGLSGIFNGPCATVGSDCNTSNMLIIAAGGGGAGNYGKGGNGGGNIVVDKSGTFWGGFGGTDYCGQTAGSGLVQGGNGTNCTQNGGAGGAGGGGGELSGGGGGNGGSYANGNNGASFSGASAGYGGSMAGSGGGGGGVYGGGSGAGGNWSDGGGGGGSSFCSNLLTNCQEVYGKGGAGGYTSSNPSLTGQSGSIIIFW